jgi:hypothetical protein
LLPLSSQQFLKQTQLLKLNFRRRLAATAAFAGANPHKRRPRRIAVPPKYIRNTGKQWTPSDVKQLKELANGDTPTRVIGLKLGRTEASVYAKASEEGVSLKPTNQSPYGWSKKK